jgi:TRAP-type uncharacterized transport system fused permease subunit
MFLQGSILAILWAVITSIIGIIGMSFGLEGYIFAKLNTPMRMFLIVCAMLTIIPEVISTIIGFAGILLVLSISWVGKKKAKTLQSL